MKKMNKFFSLLMITSVLTITGFNAKAHCEIPCGIYGDSVRIALLYEDIETIEKSLSRSLALSLSFLSLFSSQSLLPRPIVKSPAAFMMISKELK